LYGRIQLSPGHADKVVLAACVLHNYLRNDVNVGDCVIENTAAPSQYSYITFRRSGGSASEEAVSVREKYQQNCYHNLCAVKYTITHVLAPKS
jgi:hypothetical protein